MADEEELQELALDEALEDVEDEYEDEDSEFSDPEDYVDTITDEGSSTLLRAVISRRLSHRITG